MILVFISLFCLAVGMSGQDKQADITIVHYVDRETSLFLQLIQSEINALLENQYVINYRVLTSKTASLARFLVMR